MLEWNKFELIVEKCFDSYTRHLAVEAFKPDPAHKGRMHRLQKEYTKLMKIKEAIKKELWVGLCSSDGKEIC